MARATDAPVGPLFAADEDVQRARSLGGRPVLLDRSRGEPVTWEGAVRGLLSTLGIEERPLPEPGADGRYDDPMKEAFRGRLGTDRRLTAEEYRARESGLAMVGGFGTGNLAGTVVGPSSPLFAQAARRAADLRRRGVGEDEVFQRSGVYRGPDGAERMEIADAASRVRPEAWRFGQQAERYDADLGREPRGAMMTLGNLFNHPTLYRARPGIEEMPVRLHAGRPEISVAGYRGMFWPPGGSPLGGRHGFIEVAGADRNAMRSTLLHEVQHLLQNQEGRSFGTNLTDPRTVARAKEMLGTERAYWMERASRLEGAEADAALRQVRDIDGGRFDGAFVRRAYDLEGAEAEARMVEARRDMSRTDTRLKHPRESYDVPVGELWDRPTGRPLEGWLRRPSWED